MRLRGHPQPPEHSNSTQAYMDELFWQQVEYVTEDTPEQRRERHESERAKFVLAHKGDLLEARRIPEDDIGMKHGKRYKMTDEDKDRVRHLRACGMSYIRIAEQEDISRYQAWTICREEAK